MERVSFVVCAVCLLGCTGGSEPVIVAGGSGDRPAPGVSDAGRAWPGDTAIQVLCENACVHEAMACSQDTTQARQCATLCLPDKDPLALQAPPECDDQLAAYYACVAKATVACTGGTPTPSGCDGEMSAFEKCIGSTAPNCTRDPSRDGQCPSGTKFYRCTGQPPPRQCGYIGIGYCC